MVPDKPPEVPMTATGLRRSGVLAGGRDTQSIAFFRTLGMLQTPVQVYEDPGLGGVRTGLSRRGSDQRYPALLAVSTSHVACHASVQPQQLRHQFSNTYVSPGCCREALPRNRYELRSSLNLFSRRESSKPDPDRRVGFLPRQTDRGENMRGLQCARGAG